MKRYILLLIGIVAFFGVSLCDTIHSKSGYVFYNASCLDTVDNHLRAKKTNGEIWLFPLSDILKIEHGPVDTTRASTFQKIESPSGMDMLSTMKAKQNFIYPNTKLIPISLIAFGFSYYYLSSAGDLSTKKDRVIVPGVLCLAAGVVNLVFVFEKVEVQMDGEKINLSYAF
jgi:hypothetical protein